MKTTAMPIQESIKEEPSYSSQQLLDALYKIWDAFERSLMPFFLVYKTHDDAISQHDLVGDKVEVGVKRSEWISGGRRILDNFIQPIEETDDLVLYEFDGVPVMVYIYNDDPCIVALDMVRYRFEYFFVPNPYSRFLELYG